MLTFRSFKRKTMRRSMTHLCSRSIDSSGFYCGLWPFRWCLKPRIRAAVPDRSEDFTILWLERLWMHILCRPRHHPHLTTGVSFIPDVTTSYINTHTQPCTHPPQTHTYFNRFLHCLRHCVKTGILPNIPANIVTTRC